MGLVEFYKQDITRNSWKMTPFCLPEERLWPVSRMFVPSATPRSTAIQVQRGSRPGCRNTQPPRAGGVAYSSLKDAVLCMVATGTTVATSHFYMLVAIAARFRLRAFSWKSPRPLAVLRSHEGSVYSIAHSPRIGGLASGSADSRVAVWDLFPAGER